MVGKLWQGDIDQKGIVLYMSCILFCTFLRDVDT
jgi:hypothetical protein